MPRKKGNPAQKRKKLPYSKGRKTCHVWKRRNCQDAAMPKREKRDIRRKKGECHARREENAMSKRGRKLPCLKETEHLRRADQACHASILAAPTLVLFRKSIAAPVKRSSDNRPRMNKLLLGLTVLHRAAYPRPFLLLWMVVPSGRSLLPAIDPAALHNSRISGFHIGHSLERSSLLCLPRPHHQHWSKRYPAHLSSSKGAVRAWPRGTGSAGPRKRLAVFAAAAVCWAWRLWQRPGRPLSVCPCS